MASLSMSSLSSKSNLVKPIRTDESKLITVLDIIRLIFSLVIFSFASIACGYAIYAQITLMPDTIPAWMVYVIFFFCLFLLSITEGLHVAAVQVAGHSPHQYIQTYPRTSLLIRYQNEGRNFQHFLIGRQIIVVFCVFILGRITTFDGFFVYLPAVFEDITMFTGFLGVVFVVQVAQLTPQILSSNFAVEYMNVWGVQYIYYLCIILEKTGICHAVWLFCWLIQNTGCFKKAFGAPNVFEYDDLYKMDSVSTKPTINNQNMIDQTHKFKDVMHLKHETKERILKWANDVRNDLNLDSERSKSEQVEDEEKIPLQSSDKLKQKHNKQKDMIQYRFPTRSQCAKQFIHDGLDTPDFLLDQSDPNFIPPHLMLLYLLQNNR